MKLVLLMWPDTFEDWYGPLGIDRRTYVETYDGEWTVTVARALARRGVEVHLVFGTLAEPGCERQASSGAVVHFVPASWPYRALRRAVWGHSHWERVEWAWRLAPLLSTASPKLVAHLRQLAPDVVVVQDYETPRFDVAALLLPWFGLHVAGLDTGGSAAPSRMPWKGWTARRAHTLLAAHAAELERVRRDRRPRRSGVWPAPLRSDIYEPGERAAARRELGVEPGARIVLSVGRLHPVKGLHDLADACADLDCELVLVGAGSEEDALRSRERLRLTGRLAPEAVSRWYKAADVVALASRHEGQPVAIFEAFACARGVVATAVGGVPEVVIPGETGWLVPPRDTNALRSALADALAHPEEADRRGAEGRRRILERHGEEAAGRALVDLLRFEGAGD